MSAYAFPDLPIEEAYQLAASRVRSDRLLDASRDVLELGLTKSGNAKPDLAISRTFKLRLARPPIPVIERDFFKA